MKKAAILLYAIVIMALLCSCSFGGRVAIFDNDRAVAAEKFEEILEAIEAKDKDMLTLLFSKNSLNEAQAFDESVDELFDYFDGKVDSYDDGAGPVVETSKDYDEVIQIMESSYEVKTTECEYLFAVRYIVEDTKNPNNVGVQSLYILNAADDEYPEYTYWGDGKDTPGINVAVPNE